jgi:hypothetical protein
VAALRKALAPYPLELLGEWSFYLVLAPEWKPIALSDGGPAVSPAFTLLLGHSTVMDRSLWCGSADRTIQLEKWSGMPAGPAFVDFALTHELGHGICQVKNERLANELWKATAGREDPALQELRGAGFRAGAEINQPVRTAKSPASFHPAV